MSISLGPDDSVAVLAHEKFPDGAKTAVGVLRYANYDVTAVLDRERAGERVTDHVPDVPDAPIVESMTDALETSTPDALLIGISPIGGGFDESWRADVRAAIEAGCDVIAGLHYFLEDDEEFAGLAADHGVDLIDVRRPPDDLTVSQGRARDADADVVLTVGTDCSTGKMTTTLELVAAARERGIDAGFVPTGQTGIMIAGWGIPVDRVIADFAAGAVEQMILDAADDHDVLFVEGQGTIVHPAYSGVTCSLLHGAMPDSLVLTHSAGRDAIHGYEDFAIPPVEAYVDLYEDLATPVAPTEIAAGALDTRAIDDDDAARAAVDDYADAVGGPATDPVRFDADAILDALL
ncbi:DUF1611 domain-containing protein [Haloplanus aerogenes]|uniref:DUF1611 domain-containing protein n=1 Tax=Haloplanus aerogenes TaxID=660522 RepID=A0A3M0CQK3_9EURY|nr:DUF1611 domain-containing protein [Haloplanus aerogenes]AZH26784.1 DUF1611 domain-containing protein [Haloplanus aerogenes]RMB09129.1 putative NAD-dependent epimerase/dehydratase family protein [Haloplanus aerogenes]